MKKTRASQSFYRRSFLLENWRTGSDAELAAKLDTTADNIRHIRSRLGLRRSKEEAYVLRPKRIYRFTALCNYIAEYWEIMSDWEIADRWRGTTNRIVAYHRRKMGLFRGREKAK